MKKVLRKIRPQTKTQAIILDLICWSTLTYFLYQYFS